MPMLKLYVDGSKLIKTYKKGVDRKVFEKLWVK